MSNPFLDTKDLLKDSSNSFIGRVISNTGTILTIESDSGVTIKAYGNYSIGTYVYVKNEQVLGVVVREPMTVFVID
jgi:hypothetical protein